MSEVRKSVLQEIVVETVVVELGAEEQRKKCYAERDSYCWKIDEIEKMRKT
jgi:hypothetical protein